MKYGIELPKNGQRVAGRRTADALRRSPDQIFARNTPPIGGARWKTYLVDRMGFENICSIKECGQLPWRLGMPLTLQIDHVDGDRFNNELSNLRILCPDCHTQTDTYAGKRRKAIS